MKEAYTKLFLVFFASFALQNCDGCQGQKVNLSDANEEYTIELDTRTPEEKKILEARQLSKKKPITNPSQGFNYRIPDNFREKYSEVYAKISELFKSEDIDEPGNISLKRVVPVAGDPFDKLCIGKSSFYLHALSYPDEYISYYNWKNTYALEGEERIACIVPTDAKVSFNPRDPSYSCRFVSFLNKHGQQSWNNLIRSDGKKFMGKLAPEEYAVSECGRIPSIFESCKIYHFNFSSFEFIWNNYIDITATETKQYEEAAAGIEKILQECEAAKISTIIINYPYLRDSFLDLVRGDVQNYRVNYDKEDERDENSETYKFSIVTYRKEEIEFKYAMSAAILRGICNFHETTPSHNMRIILSGK